MRKNNLIKSKKHNGATAKVAPTRKSIPSKNRDGATKTPVNGSAARKTFGKNSTSADDLARQLNQAIQWSKEGQVEKAARLLEGTVDEYPDQAPVYWYLGGLYSDLGQTDRAIEKFKKAVQLAPKLERASLGLFHALWKADRNDEALEEVKRFQLLTNWSCKDYLKIMAEINEKWDDCNAVASIKGKKKKS